MALKTKCPKVALERLDRDVLEFLKGAKADLANTKVNLELVGENAEPRIITPYATYTGEFLPVINEDTKYLKYLQVKTVLLQNDTDKKMTISVNMPNAVAAEKAYADMQKAQNKYERAVTLTKILDNYFVSKNKKDAIKLAKTQSKDELVNDLLKD